MDSNQHGVGKRLFGNDDQVESGSYSGSEYDCPSDRSSESYRLLDPDLRHRAESLSSPRPQSTVWSSIQSIITSLRQVELTVRLAGAAHRQEQIQRFKNRHLKWYEMLERIAREKVNNHILFSKTSEVLRERAVESIATRLARFSYLEQHSEKISTLIEPAPVPQQILNERIPVFQRDHHPTISSSLHQDTGEQQSKVQASSDSLPTRLDPIRPPPPQNITKRPESAMSIKLSSGIEFPSIPSLSNQGTFFSCPYCLMECPAKEASGNKQWR